MKIYTEINYEFKDGELIEIDSKFFNYTGELLLCNGGGGSSGEEDASSESMTEEEAAALGLDTGTEGVVEEEAEAEPDASTPELEEDDPAFVPGKGFAQRVKGYDPYLQIQKKTQGVQGQFSRGSLRVKRPS